ncbi:MAG: hypothetical protein AABY83_08640 [Pseudomonadota bacterium]|mgnify:CR=1 FL=1
MDGYPSTAKVAIVVHFSGSTTYVDLFDSATCHARMPRIEAMTEKVEVAASRITIWPGCEPIDKHVSNCMSAQVFDFDAEFRATPNMAASRALTQKVVGLDFSGVKKVYDAKTSHAKLVR